MFIRSNSVNIEIAISSVLSKVRFSTPSSSKAPSGESHDQNNFVIPSVTKLLLPYKTLEINTKYKKSSFPTVWKSARISDAKIVFYFK